MKRKDVNLLFPPFPYFGGKRRITHHVWGRFGPCKRYMEPFCGGAAVLLANPFKLPLYEYVNDINCDLINLWRSIQYDIKTVIKEVSRPPSEVEIGAIHKHLVRNPMNQEDFEDLNYHDAERAGLWLYRQQLLPNGGAERHEYYKTSLKVNTPPPWRKFSHEYLETLNHRIKNVRFYCRDWDFFLNTQSYFDLQEAKTNRIGIYLDPPYNKYEGVYTDENKNIASDVEKWILEHEDPLIRICLSGHVGDYPILEAREDWDRVIWNRKNNKPNEILLFSPSCEKIDYDEV